MPKPDPAMLDPARYPFRCAIETCFGDLDTNLHINNVSLSGLLEEGRVRFHRASGFHAMIGRSRFPTPFAKRSNHGCSGHDG